MRNGVGRWRQGHAQGRAHRGAAVIAPPAFLLLALRFLGLLGGLGCLRQGRQRGSLYRVVRSERRDSTHSSGRAAIRGTGDNRGEAGSAPCPGVLPSHRLRQWHAGPLVLCQSTLRLAYAGDASADAFWQRGSNPVVVARGLLGEARVLLASHTAVVPRSREAPVFGAGEGLLKMVGRSSRLLDGILTVRAYAVLLEEQALGLGHELVHTLGTHRAHLIPVGLLAMQADGTEHFLRDTCTFCCRFLSSIPCWVFV